MKYLDDPDFDPQDIIARIHELIPRYAGSTTLSGRILFRPRPSPPATVYKFTSAAIAKDHILANLTLRYTQSEVLDDVFEEPPCREEIRRLMPEFEDGPTLVIDVMDPEERLAKFDRVREARAAMRRADEVISDDTAIFTADGIHREWKYELGNRQLKFAMEDSQKPLALSVTELGNSAKMWSGYGDAHRGVRLGFNTRCRYFRSNRDIIDRAGYFAPIKYRPLVMEDYAYRFPCERFFIKTPEWAEQREWRRIEFVTSNVNSAWSTEVHTFPFPPEALSSVAFGARCPEEDVEAITDLVHSQPLLAHVKFQRVRMSVGSLVIEEI